MRVKVIKGKRAYWTNFNEGLPRKGDFLVYHHGSETVDGDVIEVRWLGSTINILDAEAVATQLVEITLE